MTGQRHSPGAESPAVSIAGHYLGLEFPPPPPDRPFVYINMVSSVDGKAAVNGTERGLGSRDDKRLMQEIRSHADAVMNGASTLRISGSSPVVRDAGLAAARRERGLGPQPLGVIVSRSGNLPLDAPWFSSREFEGLVIVTRAASADQVAALRATGRSVAVVSDGPENGGEIVRLLRAEFGVRWLLCEGGPTINQTLFRAGVVDEFFLTFAPWIVGGADSLTTVEGQAFTRKEMRHLHLRQLLHDATTDEVFLRYSLSPR